MTDQARTTKDELLPCPFCGTAATMVGDVAGCPDAYCILACFGYPRNRWNTRADAADALRAQVAALQAERDQLEHRLNRGTDIQTLRASLAATRAELAAAQAKLAVPVPEDVRKRIESLNNRADRSHVGDPLLYHAAGMLEALARDNAALRTKAEVLERERDTRAIIVKRLRQLAFMAETSGGTVGPDEALKIAIKEAKDLIGLLERMDLAEKP